MFLGYTYYYKRGEGLLLKTNIPLAFCQPKGCFFEF